MRYFEFKRIAEGYANYRPYYNPLIMGKIRNQLKLEAKIPHALDIGCGAGLSTKALKEIAEQVTGTDSSIEMIEVAKAHNHDQITYLHAPAEQLPLEGQTFDLITVAGAINWIDCTRFLPEARRVLRKNGWLIIYDNAITDHMRENRDYSCWYNEQYLTRYPRPPRNETPLTMEECKNYRFQLINSEEYTNEVALSCEEYVEYMLTQSNVIAAVDMGTEQLTAAREWMHSTLTPIIPKPNGLFLFRGYI